VTLVEAMLVALKTIGTLFFGAVVLFSFIGLVIYLTDKIKNDNIRISVKIFCGFMCALIFLTLLIYYGSEG
jgi:succinate dehydrogenase hydrophobic anchor subunit